MTTIEFMALAKDRDFQKVTITCYQCDQTIVSASLCCDDCSDTYTDYNCLRDDHGQLLKFDSTDAALRSVQQYGYDGEVEVVHALMQLVEG